MKRCLFWPAVVVVILSTGWAHAFSIGGTTIVVPVVIHAPGAQSTQWRTDLWISNSSSVEKDVTVTYYPNGAASSSFTTHIGTYQTIEIDDVVLARFGMDDSKGLLMLTTGGSSGFSARARIFNSGDPAGEFGQFVPGIALRYLNRQGYIPGVTGVDGNRANVGIANPSDHTITCSVGFYHGDYSYLGTTTITVPATSVVQVNDIFAAAGVTPVHNVQLRIDGGDKNNPIYSYASIVRDGTGDAIFIFGTSPND